MKRLIFILLAIPALVYSFPTPRGPANKVQSIQTTVPQGITLRGSTANGSTNAIRLEAAPTFGGYTVAYRVMPTGWQRCKWNGLAGVQSIVTSCRAWPGVSGSINWGSIGGTASNQADMMALFNTKAGLTNPAFNGYSAIGTCKVPTAAQGTNSTQVATTAFVQTAVGSPYRSALAAVQTNMSSNRSYKATVGNIIHKAPPVAANKWFSFVAYTSASIQLNSGSDRAYDVVSGTTTTAGNYIRAAKNSFLEFFGYAADNLWIVKRTGVAFTEYAGNSYLLQETFEGTGLPSGWTNVAGTPDYDYTTTPAPLQGTQSMSFAPAAATTVTTAAFTAQSDVYASTMFSYSAVPAISTAVFRIVDGSGNSLCETVLANAGTLRPKVTGATDDGYATSVSVNTTYYLLLHYTAGTGANASCTLNIGTAPGAWGTARTKTGGTVTANASKLSFINYGSNTNTRLTYDDVRVSTQTINY